MQVAVTGDQSHSAFFIRLKPPADFRKATMQRYRQSRFKAKLEVLHCFKEAGHQIEMALAGKNSTQKIACLLPAQKDPDFEQLMKELEKAGFSRNRVELRHDLARVSLVGKINSKLELEAVQALTRARISIEMIVRHEGRLSYVLAPEHKERAMLLHECVIASELAA